MRALVCLQFDDRHQLTCVQVRFLLIIALDGNDLVISLLDLADVQLEQMHICLHTMPIHRTRTCVCANT